MILTNTSIPRERQQEREQWVGKWGGGVYRNDTLLRMIKDKGGGVWSKREDRIIT